MKKTRSTVLAASVVALSSLAGMVTALGGNGSEGGGTPPVALPEVQLVVFTEGPYVAPETVVLLPQVGDPDGWVTRVDFFANNERIGTVEGDSRMLGPMNPFRFEWRHVLAGEYVLTARAFDNDGLTGDSEPVKLHVEQAESAFIVIHRPEPHATFHASARVTIEATAVDPAADIRTVVFFANEERIGVSEFLSRMAIIPGNPIPHRFIWENVPVGEYRIQALAEDLAGNLVHSEMVPIVVEPLPLPVEVTVKATRAEAVEGAAGSAGRLVFRIVRSGPVDSALVVFYRLGGTAMPVRDFAELPGEILIPVGHEAVELVVQSLADEVAEETESVVIEILTPPCIEIYPPPPGCYLAGQPSEALGRIVDVDPPPPGELVLLPAGSVWHYWNHQAPPPGNWLEDELDMPEWPFGPAQLGYGDGDETTITYAAGPPHPMAAYFRQRFDAPADLGVAALRVKLVRDDGAAVYLNGVELLRDNLPPGELTFETPATQAAGGSEENDWHTFEVPVGSLQAGPNLIGVEVHQNSPASSDLSFDLELAAIVDAPTVKPVVSIRATVPETTEPSPDVRVQPGRFVIARTGPVGEPLTVVCEFGGTATPERDYLLDPTPEWPFSGITIPAGRETVEVLVGALDDNHVEGDETVVAELGPFPLPVGVSHGLTEGGSGPALEQPYTIDPDHARATVVIHDNDAPSTAELTILHPPPGLIWPEGEPLPIDILAVDPDGYISRVEVFTGEVRIGVSEIFFFVAPPPGTPIDHHVEWESPTVGFHVLRAAAVNSAGEKVMSEPVRITVEPTYEQVVLEVTASHPATGEPGPLVDPVPAAFLIHRAGGPLDVDVPVFFELGGTATEGADYHPLRRDLVLEGGRRGLEVPLIALADDLVEGEETVVFELRPPVCPAIYPPPPGCYRVGEKSSARIAIYDKPPDGNLPPQVVIVRPRNGAVVPPNEAVEVVAEAGDHDGQVVKLALLLNGDELAITEGNRLAASWIPSTPGEYTLGAVAIDDDGARGTAAPVKVFVRDATILSFVRRDLPAGYVPGRPFGVALEAIPPDHGIAWAVEDRPPAGWAVGEISHEGVFDPATGKVKFGPFVSREPQRLLYLVTPPDTAAGRHEFVGHGSVDGVNHPITGDRVITPAHHRHPADNTPPEMAMTLAEVTGYMAAWKQGHEWPLGPNPIPLSFVTKAGALWKHGEAYEYDPSLGAPPACWVSLASPVSGASQGLVGGDSSGTGNRELPEGCVPGKSFVARVAVQPPAGTAAWGVEEEVPYGWEISGVSHDGQFDPNTRRIRWGLFFGSEPRELSYAATAPGHVTSVGRFHGLVSFDGTVWPLGGGGEAVARDDATEVRFLHMDRDGEGPVRLRIRGGDGQLIVLECSNDLRHWKEIGPVGLVGGELEFEDLPEAGENARFYRARPIGP